jgi:hypothetical protein
MEIQALGQIKEKIFENKVVLWAKCVAQNSYVQSLSWGSMRRQAIWEVIRSWEWTLMMGFLKKRFKKALSLSLSVCHMCMQQKATIYKVGRGYYQILILDFPASQTVRIYICCLNRPVYSSYSSLSWVRQGTSQHFKWPSMYFLHFFHCLLAYISGIKINTWNRILLFEIQGWRTSKCHTPKGF